MSLQESNDLNLAIEYQEREDSELRELADSIILECTQGRPGSTLETAIFLLRQVLDQQSPPRPLLFDVLRHLSIALLARFHHWGCKVDSDEALKLMMEAELETLEGRNNNSIARIRNFDKEKQAEMIQLSNTSSPEFCQSVERSSINTGISLYNDLLLSRSPTHPKRALPLFNLSDAIIMRFNQKGRITDLDEGILRLRETMDLRSLPDPERHLLKMSLSASLFIRFSWSGQLQDIPEATSLWVEADKKNEQARESFSRGTGMLDIFRQSSAVSDLDTSLALLYTSLWLRTAPYPLRSGSLNSVDNALWTRFERKGELANLEESITFHREVLVLRPASHPNRSASLKNIANALSTLFKQKGQFAHLEESIALNREALVLRPAPHSDQSSSHHNFANVLRTRFEHKGQLADLEESIALNREALFLRPILHPLRSGSLNSLANALCMRFEQKGQLTDLKESIALSREALVLLPAPHPDRFISLKNLATVLLKLFEQRSQLTDLEESINLNREALVLRPTPHPDRSGSLNNLGHALWMRFEQKGQLADLEESIALNREALVLVPAPHPLRSISFNNLAGVVLTRFKQKSQLTDLEESIALNREALVLRPAPHPDRSFSLSNLATALWMRFGQKGQLPDLEESIALNREALVLRPAPHPLQSVSLNNLAIVLKTKFEQKGQLTDLEESISLNQEALVLRPAPHHLRSNSLDDIAGALLTLFNQKGQLADLEESIALNREALVLRPAPHPGRSFSLNNLAYALQTRFEQKGQLTDLEESIALNQEALVLKPAPHPNRSHSLNNLANVLWMRFQHKGQLADLEESIAFYREALVLFPASNPRRSGSLNNIAAALLTLFNQGGQLADLEESIALNQEALVLKPVPHPGRSVSLNNLANAFQTRFEQKGQLADLEESITLHREAFVLRPAPHPDRSASLFNLASVLSIRFKQKGQLADLEESIALNREALVRLPAPHPLRSASLNNLANVLWTRFKQKGQVADLEESMTSFCDASKHETTSVISRFRISRRWAHRAASVHHSSAMQAYQYTINLLPRLASLDLNIQQRQEALSPARGLACEACSYAIQEGQFDRAVEFLSAGRAVFWSQALQLRTPIDDLQSLAPQLANKLRTISRTLESASARDSTRSTLDNSQQIKDLEKEATHCRILNNDWNNTLEEVRLLQGFDDFLLPKSISKLQKASYNGPVVMLNAATSGCDALVLIEDSVKHFPLTKISLAATRALGVLTQKALSPIWVRSEISAVANDALQALPEAIRADHRLNVTRISNTGCTCQDLFECILGTLWLTVARPIIQGLNLKKDDLSRIWWCPTGLFSFLPIHAAGNFQGDNQECVSDYAISSYIPTLDALLNPPPPMIHVPKILVVIQPEMPGNHHLNLPYTIKELSMIERHVPRTFLTKLGTKEAPTSVAKVLSHLPHASFAHFACHGSQDPVNPLDSALLLSDGHLKVSKIMQHAIPNASLAFLSACETAKGDENAPDEAMHLAATMLFAGFRGVVGTMWSIYDEDAPEVVDVFYHHIFGTGQAHPDATIAAEALHVAVNKLRKEKKVSFQRWIPFIHLGL